MNAYFESAVMQMFRNWSSVSIYKDALGDRLHVHLTLTDVYLASRSRDKSEIIAELFARSDARHAVDLVNHMRKNTGLKRYGRKRGK